MTRKLFQIVLLTGVLSINPSLASAQGDSWYIAGGLGASFASDSDIKQAGLVITSEFDTGALATFAFGRSFGGLRAEGELAYIKNDVSSLKVAGLGSVSANGDVSATSLMANVYYDFNTDSKWKPFIGGGAGYSNLSVNSLSSMGVALADDSAGVFAYQIKAGIGYAFTESLDGTLGYRFFGTADADLVDTAGMAFSVDGLQTHVVEIGVRYRF